MTNPRLQVDQLIVEAERASQQGCRGYPITLRITRLDGTVQDIDATGVEFRGNSGLLYIKGQEKHAHS